MFIDSHNKMSEVSIKYKDRPMVGPAVKTPTGVLALTR